MGGPSAPPHMGPQMLTIAYQFHVLPRHHEHFRHSWLAAQDSLKSILGLLKCQLCEPEDRDQPYTAVFNWRQQVNFERFTRTWIGVWLINGIGLEPSDFFAPIRTIA